MSKDTSIEITGFQVTSVIQFLVHSFFTYSVCNIHFLLAEILHWDNEKMYSPHHMCNLTNINPIYNIPLEKCSSIASAAY